MRISIVFPQNVPGIARPENGEHAAPLADPVAVRDWAQAVEGLGFHQIAIYEHVVGADVTSHPDHTGPFTNLTPWHEPLVLCGYLAAVTQRVELLTAILVLPLRQTVITAKQAVEVDVLSGGRLRLGVGIGWDPFEFAVLGQDFYTRGARLAEQVALLKELWTKPSVTLHGQWHDLVGGGLCPLPVQRPIPIVLGGMVPATVRRTARLGDGWIVTGRYLVHPPDDQVRRMRDLLYEALQAAGRPTDSVQVYGALGIGGLPETEWAVRAEAWRRFGATHLVIDPQAPGLATAAEQIRVLSRISDVIGLD